MMKRFFKELAILVTIAVVVLVVMRLTTAVFGDDDSWIAWAVALGVYAHARIDVIAGTE